MLQIFIIINLSYFKWLAVSYPKIPPPSDAYNRAANFIHYFQIFLQKYAKNRFYTIISHFSKKYKISNLPYNIRLYCVFRRKTKVVPLGFFQKCPSLQNLTKTSIDSNYSLLKSCTKTGAIVIPIQSAFNNLIIDDIVKKRKKCQYFNKYKK